jgi:hypothetical protein
VREKASTIGRTRVSIAALSTRDDIEDHRGAPALVSRAVPGRLLAGLGPMPDQQPLDPMASREPNDEGSAR